mmetsp:Transcript_52243/g.93077  ORF Transcript_52243/g.93077 Transcript_52243/m.93077 type:complete len:325 (+) Transcript_52243:1-975(+)
MDQRNINGHAMQLKDWPEVRAVGMSGKRSVFVALCASRCLKYPREACGLYEELRRVGLYNDFAEMISILEQYKAQAVRERENAARALQDRESEGEVDDRRHRDRGAREKAKEQSASLSPVRDHELSERAEFPEYGVELFMVCGTVPVVGMEKASMFSEHASWLLQTALGWSGKADSLFKWDAQPDIMRVCKKAGLTDAEIFPARISHQPWVHVRAVGTGGKRSVMLAFVFALLLLDEVDVDKIRSAMPRFCDTLDAPMCRILGEIGRLSGRSIRGIDSDGGPNGSAVRNGYRDSDDRRYAEPSPKRRRETYGRQGREDDWWKGR